MQKQVNEIRERMSKLETSDLNVINYLKYENYRNISAGASLSFFGLIALWAVYMNSRKGS